MLKRFVLRAKVKIRDVTEQYDVWAAWGSENEQAWESERQWDHSRSGAVEPVWNDQAPWGSISGPLRDRRGVGMGVRVIARKGDRREYCNNSAKRISHCISLAQGYSSYDIVPSDDYVRHRILHGIAEGNTDMTPTQAFPMDSNLDFMGARQYLLYSM